MSVRISETVGEGDRQLETAGLSDFFSESSVSSP